MKYLELLTLLKDTALTHYQVNSVGNGRRSEVDEADNQLYPVVHFLALDPTISAPPNGTFVKTYQIGMIVADLLHEKDLTDSNIADMHNKTSEILEELFLRWKITEGLKIDNWSAVEIVDDLDAGLVGWVVNFQVIFQLNPTTCDLPFSDITPV